MTTLAGAYDVALLDLDGVVYIGEHAVAGAAQGLAAAREQGMSLTFVTNNASRPPEVVAEHLRDLGVPAQAHEVVTSSQAGAAILIERFPPGSEVLAVGGPGVDEAIHAVGLVPVRAGSVVRAPAAVLQGFGRDVAWVDLAAATVAIAAGAYWVVTNTDVTLPVPGGRAPGNGALVSAVAAALGRGPDEVAGKPFPALMRASIDRTDARRPLVVGDRLDTDIAGARTVGVPSLLVMTGVTDVAGLLRADPAERPDFIGADLLALSAEPAATQGDSESAPRRDDRGWARGDARTELHDGRLIVTPGEGPWIEALQCACAAAWSAAGAVDVAAAADAIEARRRTVGP